MQIQSTASNYDLEGNFNSGMDGIIGDGNPAMSRRPETAKPKSLQDAKAIAVKQLLWDEANTVYELDEPPVAPDAQKKKKTNKPTVPIRQNQMNQKVNRPNQERETYKSQHVMDGDYERAKKEAFDDNLVLTGAVKSLSDLPQTKGAFNAQQVRKEKETIAKILKEETSKKKLPSDRRAYAVANESRMFKGMPPPLKCSAAQIFYKGSSIRQTEKAEKGF